MQLAPVFRSFCILRVNIFFIPDIPIPTPVITKITDKIIDATHSNLSCPYWCVLSDSLAAIFTPYDYND